MSDEKKRIGAKKRSRIAKKRRERISTLPDRAESGCLLNTLQGDTGSGRGTYWAPFGGLALGLGAVVFRFFAEFLPKASFLGFASVKFRAFAMAGPQHRGHDHS